jgi:hypothetical protein
VIVEDIQNGYVNVVANYQPFVHPAGDELHSAASFFRNVMFE